VLEPIGVVFRLPDRGSPVELGYGGVASLVAAPNRVIAGAGTWVTGPWP